MHPSGMFMLTNTSSPTNAFDVFMGTRDDYIFSVVKEFMQLSDIKSNSIEYLFDPNNNYGVNQLVIGVSHSYNGELIPGYFDLQDIQFSFIANYSCAPDDIAVISNGIQFCAKTIVSNKHIDLVVNVSATGIWEISFQPETEEDMPDIYDMAALIDKNFAVTVRDALET